MKKIFSLIAFIFLAIISGYSQDSEKELELIRGWFKEVNSNISLYREVYIPDIELTEDLNPNPYSMEGSEIYRLGNVNMTKFFENDQLVKMVLEFQGDRQDLTSEYYFKKGDLFFVDKHKTIFHKPKWDEKFKASERSIANDRFYFKNNRLIRWINPEINSVGEMDPSYKDHELKILNDYKFYLGIN